MASFIEEKIVDLDRNKIMEVAKALFYGYILLAAASMISGTMQTGTMFGLAVLASLTLTSIAISDGMQEDWQKFLDLVSIITLMLLVIMGSYLSIALTSGVLI